MTLSSRQRLLIALVAMLVVFNIWQWWPRQAPGGKDADAAHNHGFRVDDFQFNAGEAVGGKDESVRDLFYPKPVIVAAKPTPKPIETPPAPPVKTPQELEAEAAQAELAQIKFVGMVARDGKTQAFLVKGDQLYTVAQGDKVGGRFVVEKLSAEAIALKDPGTQVSGTIPISGK